MDNNEARDILSDIRDQHLLFIGELENTGEWGEEFQKEAWACNAGIKALEKRIPKKPVGDLDSVPHYRCPNCQAGVVLYRDSTKFPCCQYCGQKLDWGEN